MYSKIRFTAIALLMTISVAFAQSEKSKWVAIDNFHTVMAATFHPAEEGNFAPLKEKATELYNAAKAAKASIIPADYKPAETKAALALLVKNCAAVQKAVKQKKSDAELLTAITAAHETFHKINGECKKEK